MNGIAYAINNILAGRTPEHAAGSAADRLPFAQRPAFLAEVELLERLDASELRKIRSLAPGNIVQMSAIVGLPQEVIAEMRQRNDDLDFLMSLEEQGIAKPYLPPYNE